MKKVLAALLASTAIMGGVSSLPATVGDFGSITVSAAQTLSQVKVTNSICVGDTLKMKYNGQLKLTSRPASGLSVATSYNTDTNKTVLTMKASTKGTYTFTGTIGNVTHNFTVYVDSSRVIYTGETLNFNMGADFVAKAISTSNNNVLKVGVNNGKLSTSTVSAGTAQIKVTAKDGSSYITKITVKQKYKQCKTQTVSVNTKLVFSQPTNYKGYSITNNGVLSLTKTSTGCNVKALKVGTGKVYVNTENGVILVYTIVVK